MEYEDYEDGVFDYNHNKSNISVDDNLISIQEHYENIAGDGDETVKASESEPSLVTEKGREYGTNSGLPFLSGEKLERLDASKGYTSFRKENRKHISKTWMLIGYVL